LNKEKKKNIIPGHWSLFFQRRNQTHFTVRCTCQSPHDTTPSSVMTYYVY